MRSVVRVVEENAYLVPVEHDDALTEEEIEAEGKQALLANVNRDRDWFNGTSERTAQRQSTEPIE